MTTGIGGSTPETELAKLTSNRDQATPIGLSEYQARLGKVRSLMIEQNIDVLYLDVTTSLRYFNGMVCYPSELLHGALIAAGG